MICQHFSSLLGMACHPLSDDGSLAMVETPFRFNDGDHIAVYVEVVGNQYRFFDDGDTFMHFLGMGVPLSSAQKTRFLRTAAEAHGASFTSNGEIELWSKEGDTAESFARYVRTLLQLVRWEQENTNINHDTDQFIEEVAQYLAAWKRTDVVRGAKVLGITGREYNFDFDVQGTLVLAVSAHHQATAAALHKLVDVKGSPANQGLQTLVVIDDRLEAKVAKNEAMVLSSVSGVIGLEQLARNAAAAGTLH